MERDLCLLKHKGGIIFMKNEIEDALWQDYKNASDLINDLNISDNVESYRVATEDRDKIRNELIKLEQMKNEKETQNEQIKSESKKDLIKNVLSIVTFGVTTGVSIYTIIKTFKFDQASTVTSTLGRNALNGVIPKLKR